MKQYKTQAEVIVGIAGISQGDIPEVKVRFNRSARKKFLGRVTHSKNVADFIRTIYERGEIELQEQFIVLYLNQSNEIVGYYKHSKGGINSTIADVRIILSTALKCNCVSIIIAHNHPSGNLKPSEADIQLTSKIKEAGAIMDISVLDHIIITRESYYSFADDGLLGLNGTESMNNVEFFVMRMETDLIAQVKHNKLSVEKLAASFGIIDKTEVKEFTELAIVNRARAIAHSGNSIEQNYFDIVDLYNHQVNLSHRTSQSILLQQYSTPAPIAYLAGIFCEVNKFDNAVNGYVGFEPSAGNGLLTIASKPENFIVNEIDKTRNTNLQTQGFKAVKKVDATEPFNKSISFKFYKTFDAVITNPPFGTLDKGIVYDNFEFKTLDHVMALRALDTMKDTGRASIIIGGHTQWDEKGRIQAGKNRIFFNYLYSHYNVVDVINIDGHKLYSRQGTAFNVRLILLDGRKQKVTGNAPPFNSDVDTIVKTFEDLYERVTENISINTDMKKVNEIELEARALELELELMKGNGLGAPYLPASDSCVVLDTVVPDSMDYETHSAVKRIKEAVGGNIDEFVRQRLKFRSQVELCKALSAEQIDAVAMAIYNIEVRKQGMIIGDQTGIGKGRIAAAMIRYATNQGLIPVFITEKANLFSDLYRDLAAIGSAHLVPFIVNGKESKTDIKDENGKVIYQAMPPTQQATVFKNKRVPIGCDFVLATYSQFNSPEKKPEKPNFISAMADKNILIMDEAHNSSGSSNTGEFMQTIVAKSKGVVFLSATFAKRPDNMPVYAMKTSISDANMSKEELVEAITKGGVALQEVLASQLVEEGQMLRRERSFEGVEVNYITLEAKEQEHKAIADNITSILRDVIGFQKNFVSEEVEELDKIAVAQGKEMEVRKGTSEAGVTSQPYFSKVFNVINQMLFSIKAEAVAERAIERLKEGKKPVIAFASTMGSFIEQMENSHGLLVKDGDTINADFSEVLMRGLDGVLRYTEKDVNGESIYKQFNLSALSPEARAEYTRITEKIKSVSTGITISPIDVIIQKLESAGYSVLEVTGRKYGVQLNLKNNQGIVVARKKVNTNDAFRKFNNNEADVLLINQSGSTGASAHAIVTSKVPKEEVRQRVMIVLQAELDINTEVQKRGRINRTGQILKPIYDYVNSAIPAEKRLMMMLQKKLKSLDANTSSNQKQSTKILDVPDFLNKYGDKIVTEYLSENPEVNEILNDPLKLNDTSNEDASSTEDAAHKVSGRVAVLSTKMQQEFYNEIAERYIDFVDYLKQAGEYDLEVEAMNLEAEQIDTAVIKVGKGGESAFGEDSILETVKANVLKKPFTKVELENIITESLNGKDVKTIQAETAAEYEKFVSNRLKEETEANNQKYVELIKNIPNEKKIQKLAGSPTYEHAIREREKELNTAKELAQANNEKSTGNRKQYIEGLLNFFYVGRKLSYPVQSYDGGHETVLGMFLGFIIDKRKKNPYAPSAMKLRFAIANSNKYIAIPASYNTEIMAIKGESVGIPNDLFADRLAEWETTVKTGTVDRKIRHIITGNLLQAFSDYKGKLVSYTTIDGATKKGILMPDNWIPKEETNGKVNVPIAKALKVVASLTVGSSINTNNGVGIIRQSNNYKIIVPASHQRGGMFYKDADILKLVEKNNFEKLSDKMVALMNLNNINKLVEILQNKHGSNVTLSASQFNIIKKDLPQHKTTERTPLPKAEIIHEKIIEPATNELELEAMALELELELMEI
jgi:DNA repair protein RadC